MSRKLRPDERELWNKVAQSATPLAPKAKMPEPLTAPKKPAPEVFRPALAPFTLGQKARTQTAPPPVKASPKMDARNYRKLTRGKMMPEARIDLHGMTIDQAHPALANFIATSHARGLRLVLVITGKGKADDAYDVIPQRRGVLRRQVPIWLRMAPTGPFVLETAQAHQRHGGAGALYVYLRRSR